MANNVYGVGLYNVGADQVGGRPYCASGSTGASRTDITFPEVTKQIVVLNRHGSNNLFVFFHTGSTEANRYKIAAGEQQTFTVKSKEVFLTGSATNTTYTLYASLTQIPASRMYSLTGSGVTE